LPQQKTAKVKCEALDKPEFKPRPREAGKKIDKQTKIDNKQVRMKSTYINKTITAALVAAAITSAAQAQTTEEIAPFVGANVATGSIKVSNGEYSTFTVRRWSGGNSTTSTVTGTLAKLNVAGQVTFQSVTNTTATSTISGPIAKGKITNKEVLQAILGADQDIKGYTLVCIIDSDEPFNKEVGLTITNIGAYNGNGEVFVRNPDDVNQTYAIGGGGVGVITQKSYDSDKGIVKSKGFAGVSVIVLSPNAPATVSLAGIGTFHETKTLDTTSGAIESRSRTNISVQKAWGADPNYTPSL
jgi:hypothetical protein